MLYSDRIGKVNNAERQQKKEKFSSYTQPKNAEFYVSETGIKTSLFVQHTNIVNFCLQRLCE